MKYAQLNGSKKSTTVSKPNKPTKPKKVRK